ncbi:glycosyltransferase family 2 protein [Primorskyibacter sp. S187A]|uniref:glycosyltransferase family 2 protein n=1 Tax=Primorskyibacter sp. S187A TaxID=3415130 RepID=UPI003C7C2D5F
MSHTVLYSVVIPHFNDVPRLLRCLEALLPQVGDEGEVIVADNGSDVDLAPVRSAYPSVQIVIEPRSGAGPARNTGVAASVGQWLFFIDADCVPAPDWISRGLAIARADHVIGGRVDVFHETPPPMSGAEAFEAVFAFKMQAYLTRDAFLGAGNLVTSRAVFDAVGGFQPAVSEDKDWSQRAARAGFTLDFDTAFAVSHPSRQDWAALARKWRRLTSEMYLLHRQEGGGAAKWLLKALAMPLSILAHAPRILRAGELSGLEKVRALATLARLRLMRMVWMLDCALRGGPG